MYDNWFLKGRKISIILIFTYKFLKLKEKKNKMRIFILSILFILAREVSIAQNVPAKDVQIKMAVMAAPDDLREGAMVYGYDNDGNLVVLREGSNDMICMADNLNTPNVNIACYHEDLETFMARGRELKKEGKTFQEIFDMREEEVKSGKLKMPDDPATLYVLSGKDEDLDKNTGELKNSYLRYVIYIPYATAETTGLPLKPTAPGQPWIMDPGTHRAHIMINPPME